jgi:hypothetical protein
VGVRQEVPGFVGKDKFVIGLDIYNFLNLLNKNWGQTNNAGFFGTRTLANASRSTDGTKYVYDISRAPSAYTLYDANVSRAVSRWQMMLTMKYQF